ncbi:MAG TPA: DUF2794 domain-containing protein [Caulobacteraceae bacterium]|jgi:hypothetical protein|nr:DUF2794 domain-containing protein [Caulobacteraceae bacterium]
MSIDIISPAPGPRTVFFDRRELDQILRVYGRMVAQGEWRDYAIGSGLEAASFAVFRRASEAPLYRIEKRPALARRQGAWAVISHGGVIVKRGHELAQVLRVFDKGRFSVVE